MSRRRRKTTNRLFAIFAVLLLIVQGFLTPSVGALAAQNGSENEKSLKLTAVDNEVKVDQEFSIRVEQKGEEATHILLPKGIEFVKTSDSTRTNVKSAKVDTAKSELVIDWSSESADKKAEIVLKASVGKQYQLNSYTTIDGVKDDSAPLLIKVDGTSQSKEAPSVEKVPDVSVRSGTVNVDIDIAPVVAKVDSGKDATFALNFKVTGSQTVYYNAKIVVDIPDSADFKQDLSTIKIAGVTPVYNENAHQLTYSFSEIPSGQAYKVNLKIATENGTTENGTTLSTKATFTADDFTGTAEDTAEITVNAAASLSTSKAYTSTVDQNNQAKTDPPTAGDIGTWTIMVNADKKDSGLLYFKEGTKIKVVDTIPDGLTYVSDNAGGVYDSGAKTVTWEFDAPTLAEQQNAANFLFNKEIEIKTEFNEDIKNFQTFTNSIAATGTDLSNQEVNSNANARVSSGVSDPNGAPVPPGGTYIPYHAGPSDSNGGMGNAGNLNPDPTSYDWGNLQFKFTVVPWRANSQTKNFDKYEINYNIDNHLDLQKIYVPKFTYAPDSGTNTDIQIYPGLDIYVTIDGVEQLLMSNPGSEKTFKLSDYGVDPGQHVSKVRFDFTKAPAGMYANGFGLQFDIEKGYSGQVNNTINYDVVGYDSNNDSFSWKNDGTNDTGNVDDKQTQTGSRQAEIVQPPVNQPPIAASEIHFDNSDGGIVKPGENRITGRFINDSSSVMPLENPLGAAVLLPEGVKIDTADAGIQLQNEMGIWDDRTQTGDNQNGSVEIVTANYNNTGRQLVRIKWNSDRVNPGQRLSYGMNVIISEDAPTKLRMDTYGFTGTDDITVPSISGNGAITDSYLQDDNDDLNGDGNTTQNRVQSANQYNLLREDQITTTKLVKGDLDSDYSKFGHTSPGGDINYRLEVTNSGKSKISTMTLVDVLPSNGDLGITNNIDRGSRFTPTLTGPILSLAELTDKVNIQYSMATNPSRADLVENVIYPESADKLTDPPGAQDPNWIDAAGVMDWKQIHSFKITLKDGAQLVTGDNIALDFTMQAPDLNEVDKSIVDPEVDEQTRAAWNSFAFASNNMQVVEPERVGVVMDFVGEAVLTKVDQDNTSKTLDGAVFSLQDADGEDIQTELTTNSEGQIMVKDLLPGDYQFVETKAPTGYVLDNTPVKFTIANNQTEAVQVTAENMQQPGDVVLTKVDKADTAKTLEGAVFDLQDADGADIQTGLTTNSKGQIEVQDLTPGAYQFIETKAPTGYVLDKTPITFTITNTQTEAVQVTAENTQQAGDVILTKVDQTDTSKTLKGAVFDLQNQDGTTLQADLTTNSDGQITVEGLASGKYQFVEVKAPKGYILDKTPIKFTITNTQGKAVQVTAKNREKEEPIIHKDVEAQQHLDLTTRSQTFNWHINAGFGNDTSNWDRAVIRDDVNPIFDIKDIDVVDETGKNVMENGKLSKTGNHIIFKIAKKNGSYSYLSGHTYTLTITTKIKASATDEELAPYIKDGGIPNQADLDFDQVGRTIHSEIPTVTPPPPRTPIDPSNPNTPTGGESSGILPHTGDASDRIWLIVGVLLIGATVILARRKKSH